MSTDTKRIAVHNILNESRNGASSWTRHPFTPPNVSLVVSDGAEELGQAAGCFWLFDILATEVAAKAWAEIEAGRAARFFVCIKFSDENEDGCTISIDHGDEPMWTKRIETTDFPRPNDGEQWKPLFILGYWGEDFGRGGRPALALCLLSED